MKNIAEFIKEGRLHDNWRTETRGTYVATVLTFDEPSIHGIDEGRISKLEIRKGKRGPVLCSFDRGWDVEVAPEVEDFYNELIKKYN